MTKYIYYILIVLGVGQSTYLNAQNSKPNIVYILADDLGYGDVGYNGQEKIKTPNIDKMAREGMIFNNHYAGAPVCGPSRGTLMTGLHTGHSTVRGNPRWTKSGTPVDLSSKDMTVAKELQNAGYTTGIIGKWGLAENLDEGMPNNQGFDYFYGFNQHKTAHHYYPEQIWENTTLLDIEGNVTNEKKGKYSHYLFSEKAENFIVENKDKPFFLYLAYTIPHLEMTIPEEDKTEYYKKDWELREMKSGHYLNDKNGHVTYASMVSRMDADIGKLLNLLEELNIAENTVVIFTSDNGHEYDNVNKEFFNSNGDFRGRKRDLYEGGLHMPFVIQWENTIKAGSTTDHVSAFWDFYPTACDIAGIKPQRKLDGVSFLPIVLGQEKKQEEHNYLYWETNEKKGPIQAIRMQNWKGVKFLNKPLELYDLSKDIQEANNVADDNPEIVAEISAILKVARTEHEEFPLTRRKLNKTK